MGYWLDGEIVITGRAKDLILHNGRNIWPQDIEWAAERIEPLRSGDVAAIAVEGRGWRGRCRRAGSVPLVGPSGHGRLAPASGCRQSTARPASNATSCWCRRAACHSRRPASCRAPAPRRAISPARSPRSPRAQRVGQADRRGAARSGKLDFSSTVRPFAIVTRREPVDGRRRDRRSDRQIIAVTGATGFVGRHVLARCSRSSGELRLLSRRPYRNRCSQRSVIRAVSMMTRRWRHWCRAPMPSLHLAGRNLGARSSREFLRDQRGRHASGWREAAQTAGVRRFVHMSSLAAREPQLSDYARKQARGGRVRSAAFCRHDECRRSSGRPPFMAPATGQPCRSSSN